MSFAAHLVAVVLGNGPVLVLAPAQPAQQSQVKVACDGDDCIASWVLDSATATWSVPVASDGGLGPPRRVVSLSSQVLEGIFVRNGLRMHFFNRSGTGGDYNLYLARQRDGGDLDSDGLVPVEPRSGDFAKVTCAPGPSFWLCAGSVHPAGLPFNELHAWRIGFDGQRLPGTTAFDLSGNQSALPAAVPVASGFLAGWSNRGRGDQFDVAVTVLDADGGQVIAGAAVTQTLQPAEDELHVDGVPFGGGALFVWTYRFAGEEVRGAQVAPNASVVPEPWAFAGARNPAVSAHTDRVLVAMARLDDAGTHVEAYAVVPGSSTTELVFSSAGPTDDLPSLARVDDTHALLGFMRGGRAVAVQLDVPGGGAREARSLAVRCGCGSGEGTALLALVLLFAAALRRARVR